MINKLSDDERKALFNKNLFQFETMEKLDVNCLISSLRGSGFCCVRGLILEDEVRASRRKFDALFDSSQDKPGAGESPEDIQRNFQKLRVGVSPYKSENSRLVRTFYNPLWEEDIYELHKPFRKMIHLRNHLLGKPAEFASDNVEGGLWTAARLQHYPPGGGFMSAHRDELTIDVVKEERMNYLQLLLILSKKGEDYQSGGGFILRDNKFIDIEDQTRLGDIILYDGSTVHGVDTIDPLQVLDLNTSSGRLVGFVTLYRDLS